MKIFLVWSASVMKKLCPRWRLYTILREWNNIYGIILSKWEIIIMVCSVHCPLKCRWRISYRIPWRYLFSIGIKCEKKRISLQDFSFFVGFVKSICFTHSAIALATKLDFFFIYKRSSPNLNFERYWKMMTWRLHNK